MKKTQTLLALNIVAPLFCLIIIAPMFANAQVTFRRPLNTNPTQVVSYYFDHNFTDYSNGTGPTQTYQCVTNAANVYDGHRGTDFNAGLGTPVYAVAQGTPYYRYTSCATTGSGGCAGGLGNHVRMDHQGLETDGAGMVSVYAHMSNNTPIAPSVSPIICGAYIGISGSSGSSTSAHLHFDLRPLGFSNQTRYDPFAGACSQSTSYWYAMSGGMPTTQCPVSPPVPTNVIITNPTASSLQVNFYDNVTNDTATLIQRKLGTTGTWTTLGTFGALSGTQAWSWPNTGLVSSQTYCYRLQTQTPNGNSLFSNEACGTTSGTGATLPAPSNVYVSNPTASSLVLNFKDNATNETSTTIERKVGAGVWQDFCYFNALSGPGY